MPRLISGRRVACLNGPGRCVCRRAAARPRDRHTRASLGVVDLEARPGPSAALRHRGQALQAPRRPPIGRACVLAMALPPPSGTAAWPRRPRDGLRAGLGARVLALALPPHSAWGMRRVWAHPDRLLSYPDLRYLSGCVAAWARWPLCGLTRALPSNFARNSPEGVSGFEIRSLIFRGFRAIGE